MIIESHAHYDDEAFDGDREQLLASLPKNDIEYVINIGASLDSVKRTVALMEQYDFIYGAIGVHPSDVAGLTEEDYAWLERQCAHPKAVAVGEIGLDYYWPEPNREIQKEAFARQLQMAKKVGLPVSIHSREAAKDTRDVMAAEKAGEMSGVIHCFSYTKETAREFLNWGYYFGIGGVVTFKNARKLKEAVAYIPIENILLETDCPYLAPVPHRGERNSSLYLPLVAKEIAAIKGMEYDAVVEMTGQNARRLFGLGKGKED